MNKFVLTVVIIAVVAVALGSVGVAFAQSPTQTPGTGVGYMSGRGNRGAMAAGNVAAGSGILHDYMVPAFAEELGISVTDLEARLANGETVADIAISQGLTIDQFRTLLVEVRSAAIDQALAGGVLTQEQADWMKLHGAGQMAGGQLGNGRGMHSARQGQYANPSCPYYSQTNP
ncbi:MAG: hypothetical protein A2030_05305 [Chloroflexi bacterium RBG_19FT_COMBO_50_10]|nr:MAG: hypothetical protein A2030_05305 [Chloroflexi bacterium RBG_19FT_COMBO_50_10]